MKKKILIGGTIVLSLLGGILLSSSSVKADSDFNPCPNGCYAGKSSCYCYTWEFNQKDAKSGGDTLIQDIIGQ